ncbi:hypothetical protein K435DRAFT_842064 [Dendrothele bispora CBS 962.96]|uniref:Uncharacterized protein n=1 Tax=Dendrothele bispora (strain CBS 962.96) TaxID=1314807 RepID=A0A4S8LIG4_DENBC|nr:hypothetical protein K435DRAFT_842064 [Dendrothele bispora CBS 962.96]
MSDRGAARLGRKKSTNKKNFPQTTSFNPHSEFDSNLRAYASQTQLASLRLLPGTALLGKSAVMQNGKSTDKIKTWDRSSLSLGVETAADESFDDELAIGEGYIE